MLCLPISSSLRFNYLFYAKDKSCSKNDFRQPALHLHAGSLHLSSTYSKPDSWLPSSSLLFHLTPLFLSQMAQSPLCEILK